LVIFTLVALNYLACDNIITQEIKQQLCPDVFFISVNIINISDKLTVMETVWMVCQLVLKAQHIG
jgi:hypothetical protein